MVRALATLAALSLFNSAPKTASVDYRLEVEAGPPAMLTVEVRLRGDADGETRLEIPAGLASDLAVTGAKMESPDATHRVLRHKKNARLTVRYRARGNGGQLAALGDTLFVAPEGRRAEIATVTWALPPGWREASDLDHAALGQRLTVDDVVRSVVVAGANLQIGEKATPGGTVRAAVLGSNPAAAQRLADAAAPAIAATRAYWGNETGPVFIARLPTADHPIPRGDGLALPAAGISDAALPGVIAQARMQAWIPARLGKAPPQPAPWLAEGLTLLLADRALVRAGALTPDSAVGHLAEADHGRDPASRGAILLLKWDEDLRKKSAGKVDLDDVVLRMADHYGRFAPGQGPDIVTGLISAAWVAAGLDLRPDIARYAEAGQPIGLPETLFDGCLDARVTVSPGFDTGFDHAGSFATKQVKGVRRFGPAWNSGVRNGMALDSWKLTPGDMTHEIELVVRPAGKRTKPKKVRYWPYGDVDVEARKLQLAVGLGGEKLAACARKLGGL